MKRRIAAIIVLYRMQPLQSVSYQTLLKAVQATDTAELDLQIFLHDNTPGSVTPPNLPAHVHYFPDASNSGLANAYNRVLALALTNGYDWLLTLDQDTELPINTFQIFLKALNEAEEHREIAAVVPLIRAGGRTVSPNYFAFGAWPIWFKPGFTGVPDESVYAFNSGSLVRTSALRQLGGYSPWFWLDNSDAYLFEQLRRFGKRVYVAGDLVLNHDFSMLNMQERISPERYRTILLAESAFWDIYRSGLAGLERTARLAVRLIKHLRRKDDPRLWRLTINQLRLRLFRSRNYRIALWRKETEKRLGEQLTSACLKVGTPMVSVCMAAYNGEQYIDAQLNSIVPQLGPADEIVIVDDASRDRTPERVQEWQQKLAGSVSAPRIIFVKHPKNKGVIRTFEEAIRSATGDILFFSDDGDLWAPDKVAKVLGVFAKEPATQIVSTGLTLIDEKNQPLVGSGYLQHRQFTTSLWANLLHNQFQGSTMAIRASLLHQILPLPVDRLFLHDVWIGTRNRITGGSATHIDEPLLQYRRHGGNFSRRFTRWKQIQLRLQLVGEHLRYLFPRR